MIIDAHTHIFSSDLTRYPLANPESSYRPITDGSATLLKTQMDEAGVDRAVTIWMHQAIIDAFGADHCLYGSNFPPVQYNPKMTYLQTVQLFAEAIPLSKDERTQILGGTAAKLWRKE